MATLTLTGAPTFSAGAAGFGNCMVLNGTTQYASLTGPNVADFAAGKSWTIEFRFKSSQSTGQPILVGQKDGGGTTTFFVALLGGALQVFAPAFPDGLTWATGVADGAWHSVAVQCINGKRLVLFVDGVLRSSTTNGTWVTPSGTTTTWLGGWTSAGNYLTGSLDEVAISQAALYNPLLGYTPATVPFANNRGGQTALWHLEADGTDSNSANTTLTAPNAAGLVYSPYNWTVSSVLALTQNPGAYLRFCFTGTTIRLLMDLSGNTDTPTPRLAARIDGGNWSYYQVAGVVDLAPVALTDTLHYIEIVFSSHVFSTQDRWGTALLRPVASAAIVGLSIDTGRAFSAPPTRSYRLVIIGDSLSDGSNVNGASGVNETDCDVLKTWSWGIYESMPAEVGIIAFSGQAVSGTLQTSTVPPLKSTWNLQQAGTARTYSPAPDVVVIFMGQNDAAGTETTVAADLVTLIQGIQLQAPLAKFILMIPYTNNMTTAIASVVATFASPNVVSLATSTWVALTSNYSPDGTHLLAGANLGLVAPRVLPALITALAPAGSTTPAHGGRHHLRG